MILGIIPARGGSKGIPRKNIKMIAGKPLIAWTIEAAKASLLLDEFVVSTEDDEIANIAQQCGANVLRRPAGLATDNATSLSVWQHALSEISAEVLVNLYPTSPIREVGLIDKVINEFCDVKPTCIATGFNCKFIPFGQGDDGRTTIHGRQQIDGFFYDDGNVYVVDAETVRQGLQYGDRLAYFYNKPECSVEIDEPFEFWVAEQVLLRKNSGI